ncbi:hypothetical protein LJR235_001081 [Pararhizobium sp. LjRoot235]|uniref:hypothetical protein n=1 Tax=Pararhizobium sp. LjRoot235 TaxID=3342291 RepID=UPI003ED0FA6E
MVRLEEREVRQEPVELPQFTPEQRGKLLGRKRDVTNGRKPDKDDPEQWLTKLTSALFQ